MERLSSLDEAIEWQLGFENRLWRDIGAAFNRCGDALIALWLRGADGDAVFAHIGDPGDRHVAVETVGQGKVQDNQIEAFQTQAILRLHQGRCHNQINRDARTRRFVCCNQQRSRTGS